VDEHGRAGHGAAARVRAGHGGGFHRGGVGVPRLVPAGLAVGRQQICEIISWLIRATSRSDAVHSDSLVHGVSSGTFRKLFRILFV
jgi:hypothetical protein